MFGKRTRFVSWLCSLLLCVTASLSISCNDCKEENKAKCDTNCNRHANCVITYGYDEAGSRSKLKRVCKWLTTEDLSKCGKCSNEKKDSKDRVVEQTCVVCNVCNAEFECLEGKGESGVSGSGDCPESSPFCRQGICSSCKADGDCKDPQRPTCTDRGCTCVDNDVCNSEERPVCVPDKDKDKTNRCGCAKDSDCKEPTKPVCRADTQECGCAKDSDCKDKNKPVCEENKCVVCRCGNTQPKRPYCLKKSDGSVDCVACIDDSDCSAPTPRCEPATRTCVACSEDSDCKDSAQPQCNSGVCVSCRCPQLSPEKPVCVKNADDTVTCVECLKNSDCKAPKPTCNLTTKRCEAACKADSDCTNGKYCSQGECVDCRDRDDCKDPSAPRCVSGVCRCVNDKDCPGSLPICSQSLNKCTECSRDGDCPEAFPVCSTSGVCELRPCDPVNGGKECSAPTHPNCRRIGRSDRCVGCAGDSDCKTDEKCDLSKFVCVKK